MKFFFLLILFFLTLLNVFSNSGLEYLFLLELFFLISVFRNLIIELNNNSYPFFEIICLFFFIDNVFSLSLIYLLDYENKYVGNLYYIVIDEPTYIRFAFLATQALYLGLKFRTSSSIYWTIFVNNIKYNVSEQVLVKLIIIGSSGSLISLIGVSELNYVSHLLKLVSVGALLCLGFKKGSFLNPYIIFGISFELLNVINSGMFGEFLQELVYGIFLIYIFSYKRGRKVNFIYLIIFSIVGIIFSASIQNVKSDFRKGLSDDYKISNSNAFNQSISDNLKIDDLFNKNYYLPLLYRLNQAYLVSLTMEKVPRDRDFEYGKTIFTSFIEAFLPRLIYADKEMAGGAKKISLYTNMELDVQTSMNIGLLGEVYVNFGMYFSIVFLFLFGVFIWYFFNSIFRYSLKNPLVFVFIPLITESLFGSGTDFMMLFNNLIKATFLSIVILQIVNFKLKYNVSSRKKNLS